MRRRDQCMRGGGWCEIGFQEEAVELVKVGWTHRLHETKANMEFKYIHIEIEIEAF